MKFYAVREGTKPGIYTNWDECKKNVNGVKGAIYKSFTTKEEAEAFMQGAEIKASDKPCAISKASKQAPIYPWDDMGVMYLGSDEVGHGEVVKSQIVVAACYEPDFLTKITKLGVKDSKKLLPEKRSEIGRALIGEEAYKDVMFAFENGRTAPKKVYHNAEYGLYFCINQITNYEFNELVSKIADSANAAGNKAGGGNALLSKMHNEALCRLFDGLIESEVKPSGICVDNFVSASAGDGSSTDQSINSTKKFMSYLSDTAYGINEKRTISDLDCMVVFERKSEDMYKSVALASNIGIFIEDLWLLCKHREYKALGMELDISDMDNNNSREITKVFSEMQKRFGQDFYKNPVCDIKINGYLTRFLETGSCKPS